MIAIVGLGNPGKNYENTVHNLGFMALDFFAQNNGFEFTKSKYQGRVAECMMEGEKVIFLKPETFMNQSGKSVLDLSRSLKLDPSRILIVFDDIDIDFGTIRVRQRGSGGTHNGLKDVVNSMGENIPRLRIGAGKPKNGDLLNYVLSHFSSSKLKELEPVFEATNKAIMYFIKNGTMEGLDVNSILPKKELVGV